MIIFVKPHQFLPVEKNCCKEKNVICLFQRQYGRPGMGEVVCIGLWVNLGTEVSMAVILSVGVRYFAPRRTLSIIWRHF